ncbi:hypothetical protein F511_29138 [Dorcoceras hygrometricum]|uniref:Uncharacterized protein n=1 Tax=Dorcoceras hygrometricum TaxID=472368 RepID=A0A2Z7BHL7_9LAMI|nr:hypothetical protein F511_29138 [Dorcoceras hygrometricum]
MANRYKLNRKDACMPMQQLTIISTETSRELNATNLAPVRVFYHRQSEKIGEQYLGYRDRYPPTNSRLTADTNSDLSTTPDLDHTPKQIWTPPNNVAQKSTLPSGTRHTASTKLLLLNGVASLKTRTLRSLARRQVKSESHEPHRSTPKPQTWPVFTILATCAPQIWFLPNDVASLSVPRIQLASTKWLATTRFDHQPCLPSTSAKAKSPARTSQLPKLITTPHNSPTIQSCFQYTYIETR